MPLNIKDQDVHDLARKLSEITGDSMTSVVRQALTREMQRIDRERWRAAQRRRIQVLIDGVSKLPILDDRPSDELIGYDEDGLPS